MKWTSNFGAEQIGEKLIYRIDQPGSMILKIGRITSASQMSGSQMHMRTEQMLSAHIMRSLLLERELPQGMAS